MSGNITPTSLGFSLPDMNGVGSPILSSNSGQFFGGISHGLSDIGNFITGKQPPQSPLAAGPTPTLADANTTALQKSLASESAAAAYGTTLTSGAGLLNSPTTTSRILLGS